jgi:hypothetical protein
VNAGANSAYFTDNTLQAGAPLDTKLDGLVGARLSLFASGRVSEPRSAEYDTAGHRRCFRRLLRFGSVYTGRQFCERAAIRDSGAIQLGALRRCPGWATSIAGAEMRLHAAAGSARADGQ